MKKFNQVIELKLSVDAIAGNLRAKFAETFAHADLLTEAIIASAMDKNTLHHVYSAMTGLDVGIDFQIGQVVFATEKVYRGSNERSELGLCKVIEINQFASANVNVEYYNAEGTRTDSKWLSHSLLYATTAEQEQHPHFALLNKAKETESN